ncbi:hypothetical protein C3K47_09145 [Solitalea longa]|uniref:DUF4249 domain-containing protein n=1 Tax=Solitalea longa TaxID=2079460 RepID=A0A2S5A339_9SPHI|nr:DUF4249 family protein [Solitalea longa]POY36533.1 hypothetical protein C3K47_09145 [Solitalea longa]
MKKIVGFLVLIMAFFTGCTKEEAEELAAIDKPVVEAYLIPGQAVNVHVTQQVGFGTADTTQVPINDLTIKIISEGTEHVLGFTADGNYVSGSDLKIEAGKTYALSFTYQGEEVSAETVIPEKPQDFTESTSSFTMPTFDFSSGTRPEFPDPVKLSWTNPAGEYHLVVVKNTETSPTEVSFGFGGGSTTSARPIFRNQPDQGTSYEINVQNFSYYGHHWVILYRINPEYAALYQQSGSNSLNLKNPSTNIKNGLGIFTGINTDTLSLTVN